MSNDPASGTVTAINPTGTPPTVDVFAQGATYPRLRFPAWYTPNVGDAVILDWLGSSKPYVANVFRGGVVGGVGSYRSTWMYSSPHTARGTCAPAAGALTAIPFVSGLTHTWTGMTSEVTSAAGAGGALRLGIYGDNGAGRPGNLLAEAGAVPTTAAGQQTVNFATAIALPPGLYWLAAKVETAVATLRSVTNTVAGISGLSSAQGASVWDGFLVTGQPAGSLPVTFPTPSSTANLPLVMITAT